MAILVQHIRPYSLLPSSGIEGKQHCCHKSIKSIVKRYDHYCADSSLAVASILLMLGLVPLPSTFLLVLALPASCLCELESFTLPL